MTIPLSADVNTLKYVSLDGQPCAIYNKSGGLASTLAYADAEGHPAALAVDDSPVSSGAIPVIVFMM